MTRIFLFLSIIGLTMMFGCNEKLANADRSANSKDTSLVLVDIPLSDNPYVRNIELAHEKALFQSHGMVAFDLVLTFGGRERFNGEVSMSTNTGLLRLDNGDGLTVVFDGENVYQAPDSIDNPGSRFDVFTWTYFFAMPYKLNDPGTIWTDYAYASLDSISYETRKLSFEDGTGDSSLDWYITYSDPEDHLLRAAAYIVTMQSSQEEAEEDPHAITYDDYRTVDGVPIAHKWTFWGWAKNSTLTDQLGAAEVSNVRFSDLDPILFDPPYGAKRIDYVREVE